jgi:hypothetical protein
VTVGKIPYHRKEPSPRISRRKKIAQHDHLRTSTQREMRIPDTMSGMCALLIRGYGQNVPPCTGALGQWAVFDPAVQESVALRQHSRAKTRVLRNSIQCCGAVIVMPHCGRLRLWVAGLQGT